MPPQKMVETPVQEHREQKQGVVAVSSGGAAAQHNLRNIGLIIEREYKNRVTQRSFIITSVILLVFVFLAAFIPTIVQLIAKQAHSQTHIVVVNQAGTVAGLNDTALTSYIEKELNGTSTGNQAPYVITSQPASNLSSLQNQVKNGQLDILLVLDRATNQDLHFTYDTDASASNDNNQSTIQSLAQLLTFLDTAHSLGLNSQETRRLAASPDFTAMHAQQSQAARPVSQIATGFVLAYAGAILIYIAVQVYTAIVATGVAEEKSSRMMELLVNAATPFQLLSGKIVGIGAACLTQMGGVVVVGIAGLLLQTPLQAALFGSSAAGFSQYLTGVSIPYYLLFLLYFLLAFFLYATLYAGLGAMVKRQEEVQSAIMLPQMLMLIGYLLFFYAVFNPDTTLIRVLSYIPFWTPWMMMPRIALGTVAWWEIILTTAFMLVAILACTRFAARIYRYGVLMYGQRPGLGQLLKLVRTN
ncbi:MAG TPA: ABC transporter permease [Ktedonobacteraceae bacterium]|jgi:ABC-2 type transport system permease protein|nr:ABC transporter permease [Ktedonobacteraceae bacterium]